MCWARVGTESWSHGLPETIYKLSGFSFYFAKVCEYWNFLRVQIRNDSIYAGVSTETCRAPADRRFYLSLLWKSHGMFVKYHEQGRAGRVKRKPCRLSFFLRLTLDVSFNWARTKHEMSRQKDPFDVRPPSIDCKCFRMQSLRHWHSQAANVLIPACLGSGPSECYVLRF